jgi:mono/diheme cytochrome c family protein
MKNPTKSILTLMAVAGLLLMNTTANAQGTWPPKGDAANGAKAWADNCGRCHNIRDGKELRDDQWITTMYHMRVRAGLTGQDTRDILSFLMASNSATSNFVRPTAAKISSTSSGKPGEEVYTSTCIACHGTDGKGTVPGAPNLADKNGRLSKSDEHLMNSLMNGMQSPGSPMAMPAKGGNSSLSRADLKNVLEYLRKTF